MKEFKKGKWKNRKQAIAVSFSQVTRERPGCKKVLKRKKKGGGKDRKVKFSHKVNIADFKFNDCPKKQRVRQIRKKDDEGLTSKLWTCPDGMTEYTTQNGHPCCKEGRFEISMLGKPDTRSRKISKLRKPKYLKNRSIDLIRRMERKDRKKFKNNPNIKSAWEQA